MKALEVAACMLVGAIGAGYVVGSVIDMALKWREGRRER